MSRSASPRAPCVRPSSGSAFSLPGQPSGSHAASHPPANTRPVRIFSQDERRFVLLTVRRRRLTARGVQLGGDNLLPYGNRSRYSSAGAGMVASDARHAPQRR
jgi:hypothetical protein